MGAKVMGVKELNARFVRIPKAIRDQVKPAIEKGATELVAFQQRLAAQSSRTGTLMKSIRWKWDEHVPLRANVMAGSRQAFYARFVEFGTVNNRPRPFFFPPYRALRTRIRRRIHAAVRKAVASSGPKRPTSA